MKPFKNTPAVAAALLAATFSFWAAPAGAQKHPTLVKAKQESLNQNHEKVVKLVKPLLEPRSLLQNEAEEAEAYELLAVSYWWLRKFKASEAAFLVLLSMRPRHRLNKAIHAEGVVKFFKKVKDKFHRKPTELRKRQKEELHKCRKALKGSKKSLAGLKKRCKFRVVEKKEFRPRWLMALPFGVGQFVNGHRKKGWAFFSVQAALALINVTAYSLSQTSYIRDGRDWSVRKKSVNRMQAVQVTMVTSGLLFFTAVAVGIVDAFVSYKPSKTKVIKIPLASGSAPTGRFAISPTFGPNMGGLNFSMRF